MFLLPRTTLVAALVTGVMAALLTVPAAPVGHAGASVVAPLAPAVTAVAVEGRYDWPLPGRPAVVRGFDPPPHRYGRGHRGIDLAGVPGLPVLAAASATVVFAGPVAGRPVVSIQHRGGLRTTYEPVLAVVSAGDVVAAGQRIGTLAAGHPGCGMAACLHWGLRRGDEYLDPLQLLAPGPLRLLPWNGERHPDIAR
jgi:murein DD-endopeptidase MepM/ murein hydrolase activator NlpD